MVKRSELFSISRPHLKAGWTPALIKAVDDWLTGAGIPADGAAAPAIIAHPPSTLSLPPPSHASFAQNPLRIYLLGSSFPSNHPSSLAPWEPLPSPARLPPEEHTTEPASILRRSSPAPCSQK